MKKQILSISLATTLLASCFSVASAAEKTPTVSVNNSQIFFEDQTPVILGEGTTLIPARGVFEAMGAKVDWQEETRTVEVTSYDNKTIVRIVLDDTTMKVYDVSGAISAALSGQDFSAPCEEITLDVAPQIINERTMIPLRAVSEALDATVDWNDTEYSIDITTADAPTISADIPAFTLSAESTTVEKDGEAIIYVNAKNIPENKFISGVTATVQYDPTAFEFEKAELVDGDNIVEGAMGASNPVFDYGYLKAVAITIDADKAAKTDGKVMKLTFKSLNGEEGAFVLSNGYHTKLGYNTALYVDDVADTDNKSLLFEGDSLNVSRDKLIINAK